MPYRNCDFTHPKLIYPDVSTDAILGCFVHTAYVSVVRAFKQPTVGQAFSLLKPSRVRKGRDASVSQSIDLLF